MPTLTLDITPEMERDLVPDAKNSTPETRRAAAQAALLAGLHDRKVPQRLNDLKPALPLPPGKTLKDLFEEFWRDFPDENTDEEIAQYLAERKKEKEG